jgi:hypothetical protein
VIYGEVLDMPHISWDRWLFYDSVIIDLPRPAIAEGMMIIM